MASSLQNIPPLVDKHNFLFKKVLRHDPLVALRFCRALQKEWDENYSTDPELSLKMKEFKKTRCIHLVWVSDKFGRSLSEEITELKTYRLLSEVYDEGSASDNAAVPETDDNADSPRSHAEDDRKSERQLKQHLHALLYLFKAAEDKQPLSEELIKETHRILMNGLYIDDDVKINAGEYRQYPVGSGMTHTYPDHTCIPSTMKRIVDEYLKRSQSPDHDPLELAAWLLFELLTLHPFENGNGRVSRLLWSYSLLRDGLPFPVMPFPEHSKAYKKYGKCIEMDRELSLSPGKCKYLTSLTLISVTTTWKNFVFNLKNESPDKYTAIVKWLEESGNALSSSLEE